MTQIAIVVYPGFTALDFIGPYEVLRNLPDAEVRFVWHEPGPIAADSGVLIRRPYPAEKNGRFTNAFSEIAPSGFPYDQRRNPSP